MDDRVDEQMPARTLSLVDQITTTSKTGDMLWAATGLIGCLTPAMATHGGRSMLAALCLAGIDSATWHVRPTLDPARKAAVWRDRMTRSLPQETTNG